uniref:sulfatase/phosphatase domain-containing protein n=1 Tax=Mariniphaga sediminis TaxID=1628158 RepID=UPI0035654314
KLGVKLENQDSILTEMFDYCKLSPRSTPYFELLPNGKRVHSSEIKGDQAIDYINKQTAGQPFCLSISFNAVHAVDGNLTPGNEGHFPYPDAVAHLYEDLTMPPPELSDPQIFENHPEFLKTSMNRIRYFWRWDTEEKYQVNMKAYFRMISGYDYVMKKILDTLKEKGLDKNTIIIFSSDNGYYMGNRGFSGKWTHYEESLRVPLIIFDPRIKNEKSSKTSDKIALNIDIPATILDYADVSIPEIYQGKSLVRIVQSETVANWRNYFFCEHRMENKDIPKFKGIHGERYVYVNYYEQNPPYEFLHDLAIDKKELINLAKNPDYQTVIDELRTRTINMESEIRNKK